MTTHTQIQHPTTNMKAPAIALSLLASLCLVQCTTSTVQTEASQKATTPKQALAMLKDGNERFVAGRSLHRDWPAQVKKTAGGQHPIAAVLGCMDSRASNEIVFDQGIGDIFSMRVAGNVQNDDVLGSLEYATAKAGAKAVVVLGHTKCGAVHGACADVHLGHLDGLLDKIQPAVKKVASQKGAAGVSFEDRVAAENVKQVVAQLRAKSAILRSLERQGSITIIGALYDLETGRVQFFDNPQS